MWTSGFYVALVKYINFALAYGLLVVMAGMLHRALANNRKLTKCLSMATGALIKAKLRNEESTRGLVSLLCEELQDKANVILIGAERPSKRGEPYVDMMATDHLGRVIDMRFGGERPGREMWERLDAAGVPMKRWELASADWPGMDRDTAINDSIAAAWDSAADLEMTVTPAEMVDIVNERLRHDGAPLADLAEVTEMMAAHPDAPSKSE